MARGSRERNVNHGITESLNRGWRELTRSRNLEATAALLAYHWCNAGPEHQYTREADLARVNWTVLNLDLADISRALPEIRSKFERERDRVIHAGTQNDEHGPTARFISAWLFRVCDMDGAVRLP